MGARCGYQRQERVAPSSHIQRKTSSEHEEEKIGLVERLEYSIVTPVAWWTLETSSMGPKSDRGPPGPGRSGLVRSKETRPVWDCQDCSPRLECLENFMSTLD